MKTNNFILLMETPQICNIIFDVKFPSSDEINMSLCCIWLMIVWFYCCDTSVCRRWAVNSSQSFTFSYTAVQNVPRQMLTKNACWNCKKCCTCKETLPTDAQLLSSAHLQICYTVTEMNLLCLSEQNNHCIL